MSICLAIFSTSGLKPCSRLCHALLTLIQYPGAVKLFVMLDSGNASQNKCVNPECCYRAHSSWMGQGYCCGRCWQTHKNKQKGRQGFGGAAHGEFCEKILTADAATALGLNRKYGDMPPFAPALDAFGVFVYVQDAQGRYLHRDEFGNLRCSDSPPPLPPADRRGSMCIICAERPANATFIHGSTGHTACCLQCAMHDFLKKIRYTEVATAQRLYRCNRNKSF